MKFRKVLLAACLIPACASAQETVVPEVLSSARGGAVGSDKTHSSVEACWEDWKKREGLQAGINPRNVLVVKSQQALNVEPGSSRWLAAREATFQQVELSAKAELANVMRATIRSDRALAIQMLGGDDTPESTQPLVTQLSLADKARVLSERALDAEIRKFDPTWQDGSSRPAQERKIATLQSRLEQNVERSAVQFASGAFTVLQCEGRSVQDNGRYSLLLAMIWSPKLARMAETIWNPSAAEVRSNPSKSLKDHFSEMSAENSSWLSYTSGARVYTDEHGEPVVVGFGVAPQTSLMAADKSRANLAAMAAIQRFVGEKIVARDSNKDDLARREFANGEVGVFDTSAYRQKIATKSQTLQLTGAAEVESWRGEHLWSGARMQVVAVAWSRKWSDGYRTLGNAMNATERRMRSQGAVPATALPASGASIEGRGSAAPTRSGAGPSTRDF